jgi:hypothetical protein
MAQNIWVLEEESSENLKKKDKNKVSKKAGNMPRQLSANLNQI